MLPLYPHQAAAIDKALSSGGSLAVFHEPGLGKTRTALEIYARLKTSTPTLKMLVVCPLSLVEAVWKTETETYTPFRWCALKRHDPLADVVTVNYEAIIRASGHRLINESHLLLAPCLLCLDESSRLKDPKSLTTKTLLAIAERCAYRLVMSGVPAPNGLHELWAQLKVVDPRSVHKSFWAWRREYFYLGRGRQAMSEPPPSRDTMRTLFQQGWEWRITDESRDRLLAQAAPICHWVRKIAALPDLPERLSVIRHVTLSSEERCAYERMQQELVLEFQHEIVTAEIALTKLQKLQQIANGWVYGETTHPIGSSRLSVLLETLEELGNQPVIIWAIYQESIRQIADALGARAVMLYGQTKDRLESLRRFGAKAQYLIAHPLSAGHGLTLTQSSVAIWYSLPWSWEQYSQANDRNHRIGTKRACLYIHLLAPNTIDEEIWLVLQKKRSLQEILDAYLRTGRRTVLASGSTSTERMLVA